MSKPGKTGFARLIDATTYSMMGLKAAWINEAGFRQEATLMVFMTPAAFWLGTSATQIALLLASCLIVVIVELLNSAIEAVVDRIGHEHHELSGRAKDLGSAAVFISLCLVVVCWSLIAYERFL